MKTHPLLEREKFLDEMAAALEGAAGGSGRTVLVSGEAGIGKTSLVERFTEERCGGARVLWGASDSLFTPRPLGPLHDIAGQVQGSLSSLLEDEAPRATIFSAFLDELSRRTSPTVAVVEDAHWADEATLDLLKFVGRRIHRYNALLVVTYRDDEIGREHPLRSVIGDLPPKAVKRLRLPPLSEAAVSALAENVGHARQGATLHAVTGGNPFFVTEVLASEESAVPATVSDAVLSRAARLSPHARTALELVSVIPAKAEAWLVEEIIAPTRAVLDECVDAGALRIEADTLAFRHELARIAVEGALTAPLRRELNARVLKALSARPPEQAQVTRLVHHATQACDAAAVLRFAPLAAKQAASLGAHRESASHYRNALAHAEALAPEERAALLEGCSYECYLTQQMEESLQVRRAALEIWEGLGRRERQGDNLRWMSRLNWFLGRRTEAEGYAADAIEVLGTLPPSRELAMAYSNRAHLSALVEDADGAARWGAKVVELAERLGDKELLVHGLNNVGLGKWWFYDEEGRVLLEESLRLALAHNFQESAARSYTGLGARAALYRDYETAISYLNAGIAYTNERDLDSFNLYMTVWRGRIFFEQGKWAEAADDLLRVLGHHSVSAVTKIPALATLGRLRSRRGDPQASEALDEARDLAARAEELQRVAPVAAARAEAAWLRGSAGQTLAEARPGFELALRRRNPWSLGELGFWMWRGGGIKEPPEGAAAPYALHISGDWRAAAAEWERLGCPYERAEALAEGDGQSQRAALEIFEQLGAVPASSALRQKLRDSGVRGLPRGARPTTKDNPAGLTLRQMEVLGLIADGLSNSEIAARLYVSPKTVDHHISAILSKLDARSRAEAVARALQSGLILPK